MFHILKDNNDKKHKKLKAYLTHNKFLRNFYYSDIFANEYEFLYLLPNNKLKSLGFPMFHRKKNRGHKIFKSLYKSKRVCLFEILYKTMEEDHISDILASLGNTDKFVDVKDIERQKYL